MGQRILTVLHYRWLGLDILDAESEYQNLLDKLQGVNGLFTLIPACQGSGVAYLEQRAQCIYPTRRVYISQYNLYNGARTITAPLPVNDNSVVTKRCATVGRGRSGSIHITGLDAGDSVNGMITSTYRALVQPVADHVTDYLPDVGLIANWEPVTWSRHLPASPSIVIDGLIEDTTRVMRRRTVGVGI